MEPENREISLRYIFEELDERRQQYFPALRHIRETGPLRGKRVNRGQWQIEVEDQIWSARDRTVIAKN